MLISGVNYHVETRGAGEPLLFLHGFSGSGVNWDTQAEALALQPEALARQFRVITVDLPGHGQTESPENSARYAIEQAASDLIGVMDGLGLKTAHLLGYSMGGRLALYTALEYPDRFNHAILESASPGLKSEAERQARIQQDEALAQRIENEGIPAFADYWTNLPLFTTQPPELRDSLHAQRLNNNPTGLANSLRGMGTGIQPSLWERLGELRLPTLLICGALDTKFRAINVEMQAMIPRAELVVVPDAGHTVHAEQPERFRAEVVRFLEGDATR